MTILSVLVTLFIICLFWVIDYSIQAKRAEARWNAMIERRWKDLVEHRPTDLDKGNDL